MPPAEPAPPLTYLKQHIPQSWYMQKKRFAHGHSPVFDSYYELHSFHRQENVPMQVSKYMDHLVVSRTMARISRFLQFLPVQPEHVPAGSLESTRKRTANSKDHVNDPIGEHDFRRITKARHEMANVLRLLDDPLSAACSFHRVMSKVTTQQWSTRLNFSSCE